MKKIFLCLVFVALSVANTLVCEAREYDGYEYRCFEDLSNGHWSVESYGIFFSPLKGTDGWLFLYVYSVPLGISHTFTFASTYTEDDGTNVSRYDGGDGSFLIFSSTRFKDGGLLTTITVCRRDGACRTFGSSEKPINRRINV